MATWQVDCKLVPWGARARAGDDLCGPDSVSGAWQSREAVAEVCSSLDGWLSRSQAETDLWGECDQTCAELSEDDEGVDVFIRIDLRTAHPALLERLLSIIETHRLAICFVETGEVCSERNDIIRAIRASSAARFVEDPLKFIEELDKD